MSEASIINLKSTDTVKVSGDDNTNPRNVWFDVPPATATTRGSILATGDVGGGGDALVVTGIQTIPVTVDPPNNGDVLTFDTTGAADDGVGGTLVWAPGGSGGVTAQDIQQETFIGADDTGTANAYAIAITPTPTIVKYSRVIFKAANANTGASTLNVNSGGAVAIKKNGTVDLASGDVVAGQIVSLIYDGTYWQMVAGAVGPAGVSGGTTWPFVLTPPPTSGWSWQNQNVAGSVTSVDVGSNRIALTTDGAGDGIAGYVRNIIAPTFTLTVGFSFVFGSDTTGSGNYATGGILVTDGTKIIVFGVLPFNGDEYLAGFKWTNGTTVSASLAYPFSQNGSLGMWLNGHRAPMMFLRIVETGSNRKYYISPDMLTWVLILSTSNTDFLTTSKYGIFIRGRGPTPAAMSLYSWTETTP